MFLLVIILWLLGFFDLQGVLFSHLFNLWQSFVTELIRNAVNLTLEASKDYLKSFFGFFLLGSLSTMYIFSRFNAISFIFMGFVLGILSKDLMLQKKVPPQSVSVPITPDEDSYCPLDSQPKLELINELSNLDYLDFWYVFF